jgi:hypothetical protein
MERKMAAANNRSLTSLLVIILLFAVAIIGYRFLTMPDTRSTSTRIGDAFHELPNGVDKAGRELEDKTPGQRIGDAVKDTGDSIKDNTNSK